MKSLGYKHPREVDPDQFDMLIESFEVDIKGYNVIEDYFLQTYGITGGKEVVYTLYPNVELYRINKKLKKK